MARVDSFVFLLVSRNTKLYVTVTNRPLFRRVLVVSRNCKKYEKSVSSCFAKLKKSFGFVVSHNFLSILYILRFSYILFEFRMFCSSFVPFT